MRVCVERRWWHLQLLPTSRATCSPPLHVSQAFATTVPSPNLQPAGLPGPAANPNPNLQSAGVRGQAANNSSGDAGQEVRGLVMFSTRSPSETRWKCERHVDSKTGTPRVYLYLGTFWGCRSKRGRQIIVLPRVCEPGPHDVTYVLGHHPC